MMRILGLAALSGASVGISSPLYAHVGKVEANGIVLTYESHGPADQETILLIAGTNMQLTSWPSELCQELVKRGYRVITYDNRDVGLSTRFDAAGAPDFAAVVQAAQAGTPAPLPYTLYDMAKDGVALLDALAIRKAHIAGVSMGGMIAQIIATNYAERTLSLTSIMATDGNPGLPFVGKPEVIAKVPPPAPDGDRKAYIERTVKLWQVIGSPGYPSDEETLLKTITRDVDRSYCPACESRQAAAALFTSLEDRRTTLRSIRIPTVVIHGAEDPLVPLEAGRDTAANIPGAELRVIPGMGHDLPRALIGTIADWITAAASRGRAGATGRYGAGRHAPRVFTLGSAHKRFAGPTRSARHSFVDLHGSSRRAQPESRSCTRTHPAVGAASRGHSARRFSLGSPHDEGGSRLRRGVLRCKLAGSASC